MGSIARARRRLDRRRRPGPPSDAIDALAERLARLEATVEGLQDAVYRQDRLHDRSIEELRRRTVPAQIAQDLSRDARRRGL